jgi:hypothetical protein
MTPRSAPRTALLLVAGVALGAPLTWAVAYFLAGAVVFPIQEPSYATRILLTLGFAALAYGVESVQRGGQITTCGFLSGNCSEHNVATAAQTLWLLLGLLLAAGLVWWLFGERRRKSESPSHPPTQPP